MKQLLKVTHLKARWYENALMKTGKMPALLAFSYFVVALSAMGVGMTALPIEPAEG